MKFALVILFGALLVLLSPERTAVLIAFGTVAGLLSILAEVKWPKAKPTYLNPTSRPKRTTPASSYIAAGVIAVVSAVFAIFAWKLAMPRFPVGAAFGFYMTAAGLGMSIGLIATAKRSSEAHNAWIASMAPQAPLDF